MDIPIGLPNCVLPNYVLPNYVLVPQSTVVENPEHGCVGCVQEGAPDGCPVAEDSGLLCVYEDESLFFAESMIFVRRKETE